jgi:ElaA protein
MTGCPEVAKTGPLDWRVERYEELSLDRLYAILAARAAVFVVEQDCPYQDLDGLDDCGLHVSAWSGDIVLAYARVLPPGKRFAEPSIGRVLTARAARGTGLGRELMRRSIDTATREFPRRALRISAQQYLERFYTDFGFETVSEPYPEDGIPHVEMVRAPSEQ